MLKLILVSYGRVNIGRFYESCGNCQNWLQQYPFHPTKKASNIAMSVSRFINIHMGDFKNNASISLINVYRLSEADLLLKLILRYVINGFLASCQVSLL